MKKSNKLLLGGFLTLLVFITAIHITLYAKYKAGNFIVYNPEDDLARQSMQSFPNILFVSVRNVSGATVRFSDVAQVEKSEAEDLQYVQKGDTLIISSKDSAYNGDSGHSVEFHLPYRATFSVFNSSLLFEAGKSTAQDSTVIYLRKSVAIFHGERSPLQFGRLRVVASEKSLVLFRGKSEASYLDVQLSNSALESKEGNFGKLSIATDSSSRLSLPAKQLLRANIKTTE